MSTYDDGPSMEEINEILEALDKATAGLGEHWPALDAARYLMFPAVKMLVREEGPEQASKTITMLMSALKWPNPMRDQSVAFRLKLVSAASVEQLEMQKE